MSSRNLLFTAGPARTTDTFSVPVRFQGEVELFLVVVSLFQALLYSLLLTHPLTPSPCMRFLTAYLLFSFGLLELCVLTTRM